MSETPSLSDSRLPAVLRAVKEWTEQLIDLGGRNTLLHFRPLKVGTLDLARADHVARESLLDGREVLLDDLFPDPEERAEQAKRCRAIRGKAKEHLEERGLRTLSVGIGLATWTSKTPNSAVPAAPLLLRPLDLVPQGPASESFKFISGDEWEFNPTLLHKLKVDFGVDIEPESLLDGATGPNGSIDTAALFRALKKQAADVPGFMASDRWIVANLSYAKMPLVADLENSATSLAEHPVVAALAGSHSARDEIRDEQGVAGDGIDLAYSDRMNPADEFIVLDADASQSQVINLAVAGTHLVIQGPPGTGKSQTIANLVATLVARGRSVLFVAEKRAAIDAVTSRLNSVGLSNLVLDLHEGAASRKKVATEIGRALETINRTPALDHSDLHERLTSHRRELNSHPEALHEVRAPWGESVFELQAQALDVPPEYRCDIRIYGEALHRLNRKELRTATEALTEWINLGGVAVERAEVPWAHAMGTVCENSQVLELQQLLQSLRGADLPNAYSQAQVFASELGLRAPRSRAEALEILTLARDATILLDSFTPEIFRTDLEPLIDALTPATRAGSSAIATIFNAQFKGAKRAARTLTKTGHGSARDLRAGLVSARDLAIRWSAFSIDGIGPRPGPTTEAVDASVSVLTEQLERLTRYLPDESLLTLDFVSLESTLRALTDDSVTLQRLPRLHQLRTDLSDRGLDLIVGLVTQIRGDTGAAAAILRWVRANSVLEYIGAIDNRISTFDGNRQSRIVQEFTKADADQIANGAARVRRAVAEHAFRAKQRYPDQTSVLERNAKRKQRHASVRDLMSQAPDLLSSLMPCWVMSPLVVAQLLPSGQPLFDVVIFDEASQIRPADAISAISRGRQVIVAGDSRQLPPTSFFDVTSTTSDTESPDGENETYTQDMDSILDAMSALLPPPHGGMTLNWHYRSRDERLIAFSNAQPDLYDWSLTTFPGVNPEGCLRHELVPFRPGLPGLPDSSSDEVQRVVDLIREHVALRPDMSLGVIAMGIKHAERIQETLRIARRDDPTLNSAPCLDENRSKDPFFIKNLERVQGDERDAIILTIGYTKTSDGRMQYRFGPLNQQGGERRLNVAITRAREQMTVVSSFGPDDMDDTKLTAQGAKMLKRYLTYVRSGGRELGDHGLAKPALNPFERDVRERLAKAGIPLIAQYGVAGYWIDFAASHPQRPGEMVLAIEADGASYHSSPTARARDRLRQTHLERLGWTFHRIWSTDWFRNPEVQTRAVVAAYEAAVSASDARTDESPAVSSTAGTRASKAPTRNSRPSRSPRPRITPGLKISAYSDTELDQLCRWIISDTLLRTDDELLDAMRTELGFQRRGSQIVARLQGSIGRVRNESR